MNDSMTSTTSSSSSSSDLTLILGAPVTAHGQSIDRLTLRQPTTADLIDLGQPMRLLPGNGADETAIDVRMNVVANYVVRLAAVPLSTVKALSLADFGKATQAVLGFFGDANTVDAPSAPAPAAPTTAAADSSPTVSSN